MTRANSSMPREALRRYAVKVFDGAARTFRLQTEGSLDVLTRAASTLSLCDDVASPAVIATEINETLRILNALNESRALPPVKL